MENEFENNSMNVNLNIKENSHEKLWNHNFILMLQGQLVSVFGDYIYEIALSFWVLTITGSTALMSTVLAATVVPSIIVSPIAGTFIDRHDRRIILIITDIIRGITILFIGTAAVMGFLKIWMILIVGVITGICGCFFSPAINSSIPDIVPNSKLIKANSALSLVSTINYMAGNTVGCFLIQIFGAPIIFLFNGISFLVSAIAELFIKIPPVQTPAESINFLEDMKGGMTYVKNSKGLKYLFITICFFNAFASMSMTLTLPWFTTNKAELGLSFYGIAMAVNALGMFIGFSALSSFEIKNKNRFSTFVASGIILSITMIIYALTLNNYLIIALFLIDGFCIAVLSSLIQSSIQNNVPANMRGKAFALKDMLVSTLAPLSIILAGILAEIVKMNYVILVDYVVFLIIFLCLLLSPSVKELINK